MDRYPTLAEEYAYIDGHEDGHVEGYKHAFEKAVEWLKNNLPSAMVRSDYYMFNGGFIEDFKKPWKEVNNETKQI